MPSQVLQNLLVALGVCWVLCVAGWLRRRPLRALWLKRLWKRNPIALCVIGAYAAVALVDSCTWISADGAANAALDRVTASEARSPLDRWLGARTERGYSAPLARNELSQPRALRFPGTHLLGTDILGRDVLYLTLKGAKVALLLALGTSLFALPLGLVLGVIAGNFGGVPDKLVSFCVHSLSAVPAPLLILATAWALPRNLFSLCIAMALVCWVPVCRVVRAEAGRLRELAFVRVARGLGASEWRVVTRHVVPHLAHLVIIKFALLCGWLVIAETILSWAGLGALSSWGTMLLQAQEELLRRPVVWWNLAAAMGAILGLVLPFHLVCDGLQAILDSRRADAEGSF